MWLSRAQVQAEPQTVPRHALARSPLPQARPSSRLARVAAPPWGDVLGLAWVVLALGAYLSPALWDGFSLAHGYRQPAFLSDLHPPLGRPQRPERRHHHPGGAMERARLGRRPPRPAPPVGHLFRRRDAPFPQFRVVSVRPPHSYRVRVPPGQLLPCRHRYFPSGRWHGHLHGRPLGRRRASRCGFGRDDVHAVGLPQRVGRLGRQRPPDVGGVVGGRRPPLLSAGTSAVGGRGRRIPLQRLRRL